MGPHSAALRPHILDGNLGPHSAALRPQIAHVPETGLDNTRGLVNVLCIIQYYVLYVYYTTVYYLDSRHAIGAGATFIRTPSSQMANIAMIPYSDT